MKKLLLLIFAITLIQTAFGQADKDSTNLLEMGSEMPEFSVVTLDGKSISSDDLYGKVVLINFFATWCVPCNLELPLVEKEIWAKYKDNEDFVLLIIDREEKAGVVKAFIEKKKWTMPFCLDEKMEVYSKFATKYIPRNYLFDKESSLVLKSNGFNKEDLGVLKTEIENQLKKQN
jgi:peroxiredoxin